MALKFNQSYLKVDLDKRLGANSERVNLEVATEVAIEVDSEVDSEVETEADGLSRNEPLVLKLKLH